MSPEHRAAGLPRQAPRLRQAAETLSQRLPALLVEAERVAATVAPGVHGRRRTGMGETFWQFRQYQAGDAADAIDWRQSARSRHLFVREQEWEAAESVWIWCDLSPSMAFRSGPKLPLKWERAALLTLALAALLVRGGERVALLGGGERPATGRFGMETLTRCLAARRRGAAPRGAAAAAAAPRAARPALRLPAAARPAARAAAASSARRAPAPACCRSSTRPRSSCPTRAGCCSRAPSARARALIDHVGGVRARYAELFRAHRESLAGLAGRQGWRFTTHRTDRTAELALLSLVAMLAPRMVS